MRQEASHVSPAPFVRCSRQEHTESQWIPVSRTGNLGGPLKFLWFLWKIGFELRRKPVVKRRGRYNKELAADLSTQYRSYCDPMRARLLMKRYRVGTTGPAILNEVIELVTEVLKRRWRPRPSQILKPIMEKGSIKAVVFDIGQSQDSFWFVSEVSFPLGHSSTWACPSLLMYKNPTLWISGRWSGDEIAFVSV